MSYTVKFCIIVYIYDVSLSIYFFSPRGLDRRQATVALRCKMYQRVYWRFCARIVLGTFDGHHQSHETCSTLFNALVLLHRILLKTSFSHRFNAVVNS